MHRFKSLTPLLALLLVLGSTSAQSPANPSTGKYCTPLAFRDSRVIVGYQAVIRAAPGCLKPALVRKENTRTGSVIGDPWLVPVGKAVNVWVFTHRLKYSLDGKNWFLLGVR